MTTQQTGASFDWRGCSAGTLSAAANIAQPSSATNSFRIPLLPNYDEKYDLIIMHNNYKYKYDFSFSSWNISLFLHYA